MFAYTYPILDIFWSIFLFFVFFLWIWVLILIFTDLFRSRDISGFGKAMWFLFILFIPIIGMVMYLIVRGHSMHERAEQAAQEQDKEFRHYVREAAGNGSSTDQLVKLSDLRQKGLITDQEFNDEKAKILSRAS